MQIESSISRERNLISSFVVSLERRSNFGVFMTFFSEASAFFTGRGHSSHFSVFMDRVADPVDSWVVPNGIVVGVNANDFVKFVGSVFGHPIGV